MTNFRKILNKSQHDAFKSLHVPALYFPSPTDIGTYSKVHVIVSQFFIVAGQPVGDRQARQFPVFDEKTGEVTFRISEMPNPANGSYIIISPSEGYVVKAVKPPYLGNVTAKCSRLSTGDSIYANIAGIIETEL